MRDTVTQLAIESTVALSTYQLAVTVPFDFRYRICCCVTFQNDCFTFTGNDSATSWLYVRWCWTIGVVREKKEVVTEVLVSSH